MKSKDAKNVRVGQAILDAAAVVKELVENSIDAGATRVDIFLKGKAGIDRITVVDNGCGVRREDYSRLCAAHATSKIAKLDDLDAVTTLGFRGEAMSAIAALAESVTVTTKTETEAVGCALLYSADGTLVKETPTARKRGATVQVDKLFARLPVRLEDAHRHSSRDLARCLSLSQAYALMAPHVRFEMRVESSTRLLTQPQPGASLEASSLAAVEAVLGRGLASSMVPCAEEELLSDGFALRGFVSKSGSGGSGKQFVFLNNRPVDMPRLVRAVNESFRRSSTTAGNASPAFVLFLSVPPGSFDVNLSPDKRAVMLHREAEVVRAVQRATDEIWMPKSSQLLPTGALEESAAKTKFVEAERTGPAVPSSRPLLRPPGSAQTKTRPKSAPVVEFPAKTIQLQQPALLSSTRTFALTPGLKRRASQDIAPQPCKRATISDRDTAGTESSRAVVGSLSFSMDGILRKRSRGASTGACETSNSGAAVGSGGDNEDWRPCKRAAFSAAAGSEEVDADKAERELAFSFDKSWFSELKVLGQFNLGFIICLFRSSDVFIVDQHAADEKFNYEDLEKTTSIEKQALVKPLPLDLGVEDELLVIENRPRFRAGGFDIEYRPEKPPTKRLRLRSQPCSKRTVFVTDDFHDLVASLKSSDSSTFALRPARVRSMLASRACRKSIMIGTPLTAQVMTRVVRSLETLEHPWSCPHGRPTMRHLVHIEK